VFLLLGSVALVGQEGSVVKKNLKGKIGFLPHRISLSSFCGLSRLSSCIDRRQQHTKSPKYSTRKLSTMAPRTKNQKSNTC